MKYEVWTPTFVQTFFYCNIYRERQTDTDDTDIRRGIQYVETSTKIYNTPYTHTEKKKDSPWQFFCVSYYYDWRIEWKHTQRDRVIEWVRESVTISVCVSVCVTKVTKVTKLN